MLARAAIRSIAVAMAVAGLAGHAERCCGAQANSLPARVEQQDLTGSRGTLAPRLVPPLYRVAATVWADLNGDGIEDLAIGLEPDPHAAESEPFGWMFRPAGVVVYFGSSSGALKKAWEFPEAFLSLRDREVHWNQCESLAARDVTGDGKPELVFKLPFIGADYSGADTFVFGYRNGTFANLVPGPRMKLPRYSFGGPGKTPLGQLGGEVRFLGRGRGKPADIAIWGWFWADEAKVDPHRYWGALFRWSPKEGIFTCIHIYSSKRKGEAGERETMRGLGVRGEAVAGRY